MLCDTEVSNCGICFCFWMEAANRCCSDLSIYLFRPQAAGKKAAEDIDLI